MLSSAVEGSSPTHALQKLAGKRFAAQGRAVTQGMECQPTRMARRTYGLAALRPTERRARCTTRRTTVTCQKSAKAVIATVITTAPYVSFAVPTASAIKIRRAVPLGSRSVASNAARRERRATSPTRRPTPTLEPVAMKVSRLLIFTSSTMTATVTAFFPLSTQWVRHKQALVPASPVTGHL